MGGHSERMEWNLNQEATRTAVARRARILRWRVPGRSKVVHPAHGAVVVPHASNLCAIMNAAEVWGCDWAEILDAQVWAAPGEKAAPMPTLYK